MEGHFSTGQSPQWAVVPMEEEEEHQLLVFADGILLGENMLSVNKNIDSVLVLIWRF